MSSLTPLQIELVKTFSHSVSEEQVLEIRQLLADYFARKLDEAVDRLSEDQQWTSDVADHWLNEHMRTPYHQDK